MSALMLISLKTKRFCLLMFDKSFPKINYNLYYKPSPAEKAYVQADLDYLHYRVICFEFVMPPPDALAATTRR